MLDIRRFLGEFRKRLQETKTDKALIRMINDSLQAFGPEMNDSNLLLNRYMDKKDSLFNRIERVLDQQQQRKLEESKLPVAAQQLAPA